MADKINPIAASNASNMLAAAPDGTLLQVPFPKLPPDLTEQLAAAKQEAQDAIAAARKEAQDAIAAARKEAQDAIAAAVNKMQPKSQYIYSPAEKNVSIDLLQNGKAVAIVWADSNPRVDNRTGNWIDICIDSQRNPGIQSAIAPNQAWILPNIIGRDSNCFLVGVTFSFRLIYAPSRQNKTSILIYTMGGIDDYRIYPH